MATPSHVVSSFVQRVTQWMSVSIVLRGRSLNCCQVRVNGASTSPHDLEVPGGEVDVRHGAVVEDRELVRLVLAGRDAPRDGWVLVAGAEESFEHGLGVPRNGGLLTKSSHMRTTVP